MIILSSASTHVACDSISEFEFVRCHICFGCDDFILLVAGYFGHQVAWYFAWLQFYSRSLCPIAVLGIIVFALSSVAPVVVPMFAIFVSIWGSIYVELWQRRRSVYQSQWAFTKFDTDLRMPFVRAMRNLYMSDENTPGESKHLNMLANLVPGVDAATLRKDIDEYDLYYYPAVNRLMRRLFSTVVCFLCCLITVFISLTIFEVEEFFGDYEDKRIGYAVCGLIQGMVVPILNGIYENIVTWLTDNENIPTWQEHKRSTISKLFIYQFINNYFSLFWIAFARPSSHYTSNSTGKYDIELRATQLQFELALVFSVQQALSLVQQIIVPYLNGVVRRRRAARFESIFHRQTLYCARVCGEVA